MALRFELLDFKRARLLQFLSHDFGGLSERVVSQMRIALGGDRIGVPK